MFAPQAGTVRSVGDRPVRQEPNNGWMMRWRREERIDGWIAHEWMRVLEAKVCFNAWLVTRVPQDSVKNAQHPTPFLFFTPFHSLSPFYASRPSGRATKGRFDLVSSLTKQPGTRLQYLTLGKCCLSAYQTDLWPLAVQNDFISHN